MKGPLLPIPPQCRVLRQAAVWLGLFSLAACSGFIEEADQSVTVFTDPPGAYCVLSRNGATVGVVTPSPGLLHINNSKDHISVRCSKALHENESAVLASSRRDLTIGDIVVKGPIGLAVDAGTGASHQYPSSITLYLAPVSFESEEERDRYYDRRKGKIADQAADAIARVESKCGIPFTRNCGNKVKAVEAGREAGIADLEAKRQRARISGG